MRFLGDDIDLQANSNFIFISDRQKGLLQAIGTLYPCAEHRKCGGERCFRTCCGTVQVQQQYKNSTMLWKRRAHCDGLLNNLCETINNQIKKARDQQLSHGLKYLMLRIVSVQKVIDKAVGPRKKRKKSAVELEDMVKGGRASRKDKSVTCSKCKKLVHNKRRCRGQSACDASSSKKWNVGNKAKSVGDGSSIKKGKDGKNDQSSGDGTSSKKGNVGKKARSVGGGKQCGTQSVGDGISSRTREKYCFSYDCLIIFYVCVMN
uniref:Uncharacterized protein n=1 Tax=Lactuca sativa TaxID=4236 RepID=A0A9R1XFP1_LACSA|nr:hypothetical protein LSAT_V11C500259940 [Lactuca sativa]